MRNRESTGEKFQGHPPRQRGRRALLVIVLVFATLALLVAGCGQEEVAAPQATATKRPTFTPSPPAAQPTATATPAAVSPIETPPGPAPSDTPAAGDPNTPVPLETQTPQLVTATPSPALPTATLPPSAPTETPVPGRPVEIKSPDYGMQAFLWWRAEVAQRDLEMIRDAGFRWVKQGFGWREIEGAGKGRYDWSVTDRIVSQVESVGGLHIIARLDNEPTWASGQSYPNPQDIIMSPPRNTQDYADFCYAVALRYRGRIAAYQVWNEPNLSREWGGRAPDPASYTTLLRACYQAIKRADPNALVISAGLAPTTQFNNLAMPDTEFLRRMYAAGARPYFDLLGAHGAGYKAPPEADPALVSTDPNYYNVGDPNCPGPACRVYCFRHVEDMRQVMVENGDAAKRVVVLEFGWTMDPRPDSPYRWHAVSEQQQAAYLVGAYEYAKQNWQPWIAVMSLIYMPNIDWTENDEQYWWSIAIPNYPQFYPYKSYRDLAAMPK